MTREQIYNQCVQKIDKTNTLLLQAATGTGKTKISIDLVNYLLDTNKTFPKKKKILILVAKKIHKQTWLDEITKWGGIGKNSQLTIECYESLKKHTSEYFDIVLADEVHHIGSEVRLELFSTIKYSFFIGLSAIIGALLATTEPLGSLRRPLKKGGGKGH
jgi:superfamily II DNA or RNA helicase